MKIQKKPEQHEAYNTEEGKKKQKKHETTKKINSIHNRADYVFQRGLNLKCIKCSNKNNSKIRNSFAQNLHAYYSVRQNINHRLSTASFSEIDKNNISNFECRRQ